MSEPLNGVSVAILAGGLGTRLRSVIADRPKVLAPVAGKPFLAHLLDRLADAGVRQVVLLVGYAADQVRSAFGDRYGGMELAYSVEPEPLGTGGALRFALPLFDHETVMLLNGDSSCDLNFAAFAQFHRTHDGMASIALTSVENAARFGRVVFGADGRVQHFEEKQPKPAPGWINAGIYLLNRSLIEAITPGCAVSLERDLMPDWVADGSVFGFAGGGRFIDIGVPESYAEAAAFFAQLGRH